MKKFESTPTKGSVDSQNDLMQESVRALDAFEGNLGNSFDANHLNSLEKDVGKAYAGLKITSPDRKALLQLLSVLGRWSKSPNQESILRSETIRRDIVNARDLIGKTEIFGIDNYKLHQMASLLAHAMDIEAKVVVSEAEETQEKEVLKVDAEYIKNASKFFVERREVKV